VSDQRFETRVYDITWRFMCDEDHYPHPEDDAHRSFTSRVTIHNVDATPYTAGRATFSFGPTREEMYEALRAQEPRLPDPDLREPFISRTELHRPEDDD
jgi:hypothetical protein